MEEFTTENDDVLRWDLWHLKLKKGERESVLASLNEATQSDTPFEMDPSEHTYILGYLNAPREYYDGDKGPCKHHFATRVGIALTQDFENVYIVKDDMIELTTEKEREEAGDIKELSSPWTGSFVKGARYVDDDGKRHQQYVFFYTHRIGVGPQSPDGMTQEIKAMVTEDFVNFEDANITIKPDPRFLDVASIDNDTTIHAFRDPSIFRVDNRAYMLITAQDSKFLEQGRQGEYHGENGVIAVYRAKRDNTLQEWEPTSLRFAVGMSEAEVPSIYRDVETNEYVIAFSAIQQEDYLKRDENSINGHLDDEGKFFEIRMGKEEFEELLSRPPKEPVVVKPEEQMLHERSYANRYIESFGGVTVGFHKDTGGACISNHIRRPELKRVPRSFRGFEKIETESNRSMEEKISREPDSHLHNL